MKINVTQQDIEDGLPSSPWVCPIANAINRENPSYMRPAVTKSSVIFNGSNFVPSKAMIKFMDKFDYGEKVKPCSFIMKEY